MDVLSCINGQFVHNAGMAKTTFPIFEKLGGTGKVHEILGGADEISIWAIRKWPIRGTMPGSVILKLQDHCDENEIDWSPSDFRLADEQAA